MLVSFRPLVRFLLDMARLLCLSSPDMGRLHLIFSTLVVGIFLCSSEQQWTAIWRHSRGSTRTERAPRAKKTSKKQLDPLDPKVGGYVRPILDQNPSKI
eukprot:4534502-Karenia_brevis.AAC.1